MWYRWHDEETEIQFAQRIKYLEFAYPNHKFITEAQVKEICTKYNLVCGEIFRYKGFVPEINLTAIENFKIKMKMQEKTLYI